MIMGWGSRGIDRKKWWAIYRVHASGGSQKLGKNMSVQLIDYNKPLILVGGGTAKFLLDTRTVGSKVKFPYLCLLTLPDGSHRNEFFNEYGYADGGAGSARIENAKEEKETRLVIDTSEWKRGDKIPLKNGNTMIFRRINTMKATYFHGERFQIVGDYETRLGKLFGIFTTGFWNDDGSGANRRTPSLDTSGMKMKSVEV